MQMIVDHAAGFEEREHAHRADELEAASAQVAAERVGKSAARQALFLIRGIDHGAPVREAPDVRREAAEFPAHVEKAPGVIHDGAHFAFGVDHLGIGHDPSDCCLVVSGHLSVIEPAEIAREASALAQHQQPAQPAAHGFHQQMLEEDAVVMLRHTPLAIVIFFQQGIRCAPGAAPFRRLHSSHVSLPRSRSSPGKRRNRFSRLYITNASSEVTPYLNRLNGSRA